MAIVKMAKLQLVGLKQDQSRVLDELFLSHNVQIVKSDVATKAEDVVDKRSDLELEIKNVSDAISFIEKANNEKIADKFEVGFDDFIKIEDKENELKNKVAGITEKIAIIQSKFNEILALRKQQQSYIPDKLKKYSINVEKSKSVKSENKNRVLEKLYKELLNSNSPTDDLFFELEGKNNLSLNFDFNQEEFEMIKLELAELDKNLKTKLTDNGVVVVSYVLSQEDEEKYLDLEEKINNINLEIEDILKIIKGENENLKDLKMYSDFLSYKLEKYSVKDLISKTDSTFILNCYTPKSEVKSLKKRLEDKFETLIIKEKKITPKDNPPTLTKNGKIIKMAEFVTNMYSPPSYNEVDPNLSVFFFFMIFFGFIMADIGYGILLIIIGSVIASRIKEDNGAKRLWSLIAMGGVFTIIWGILFGSFFGFSHSQLAIIPKGVMPDPTGNPLVLMLVCLLMGVVQIAVGFALRGVNAIKCGRIFDGIVNGFMWTIFMIGVLMASTKPLLDFFKIGYSGSFGNFISLVSKPGLIITLVSLGIAVVFAGIGVKGFGKFTKSFSALYGLINLFSDILSYTRLFGLMLSGAIIGSQFNTMGLGMMTSPLGYILGGVIILIGHAFNLAMGALGAYIHDIRLQYIEYFAKFYNGEGEEFKPFGFKLNYVKLN